MVDLNALSAAAVVLCLLIAVPAAACQCPPYWQCNGKAETNHPNCRACKW